MPDAKETPDDVLAEMASGRGNVGVYAQYHHTCRSGMYPCSRCDIVARLHAALDRERAEHVEKMNALHRRCQAAESAANEKIEGHGPSFGRALANYAAADWQRKHAALVKAVEDAADVLKRRIPPKERGPWKHGWGCPAEVLSTDNAACTCGAWSQIDADQATLARLREAVKGES